MKYIIMCGGTYIRWSAPRQLTKIHGECLVARTIRLLRENGVEDIAISAQDNRFEKFGVPVLYHKNYFEVSGHEDVKGAWYNCFYPTDESTCYLFGDVVYSPKAIKTIIEYKTDKIMFFASAPPFAKEYPKPWVEPFAFKVTDTEYFKWVLKNVREYDEKKLFQRPPIAWEVWQCCLGKSLDYRDVDYSTYVHINDYTCDIDQPEDIVYFEGVVDG